MIAHAAVLALALAAAPRAFEVAPAGRGGNRLDVPPELLSASARGDLADLRLRDAAGREVPHLLVAPPAAAPSWVAVARIRPIPGVPRKESGVELDLGVAREVAALRLHVPDRVFARTLRLEGSVDGRRWTTLAPAATLFAVDHTVLPGAPSLPCDESPCGLEVRNDVVRFEPARVRHLRVVFDDRGVRRLGTARAAEVLLAGDAAPGPGPDVPLAIARREAEPDVSRFALGLPGPHLPVRAVRVEVDARHLWRAAELLEARLDGGRLAPQRLGGGLLTRTERDGVAVADLRLPLSSAPEELELELVAPDGDGGPLPLRRAVAELAPLPWIYFESPDGAPLTATVGDAALRAPRYDLEAARRGLRASALPRARLAGAAGPAAPPAPAAPAVPDAALPGAPLDAKAFRVARSVAAAPPGLAAVRLDAAILAESPDAADVRLAGPDGRQLPYLAEVRPEPLAVPLAASAPLDGTPVSAAGATVRALPLAHGAAPASRLVLETSARVFRRSVRVHVEGDDPAAARGVVAEARWEHADPARPAPRVELPLPAVRGERLLVVLDDGDNAPLPITGATLLLPAFRLRFFHPGAPLTLLHGAALPPPRYDLDLLAPRLRGAPAREVELGPAPAAPARGPSARAAFWAVLGGAVVGLLALVARLVRRDGAPRDPAAGS